MIQSSLASTSIRVLKNDIEYALSVVSQGLALQLALSFLSEAGAARILTGPNKPSGSKRAGVVALVLGLEGSGESLAYVDVAEHAL